MQMGDFLPKRRILSLAFGIRFIPWSAITFGVLNAVALGIGDFSPMIGTIIAKSSLVIAVAIGWNAGRELSGEEVYQWRVKQECPPPLPKYYFRVRGEIRGPELLSEIKSQFTDFSDIEVIEAAGQDLWELRRSIWTRLSVLEHTESKSHAPSTKILESRRSSTTEQEVADTAV